MEQKPNPARHSGRIRQLAEKIRNLPDLYRYLISEIPAYAGMTVVVG